MEGHRESEPSGLLLDVRGASVRFAGISALEDVTIRAHGGEVVGVIGPNGAGKTTLFNVICGFVRPQAGTISWRGERLAAVKPHRLSGLGIARTLQGVGLFEGLSALENVMVGAHRFRRAGFATALFALRRSERDERALRERATDAMRRLGCEELADRMPSSLTYAARKRVALARALVGAPDLLLLDEPAGGLDAGELERLAALVGELRGSMAVMLVDHHMDFVTSVCDRLVALDFGRVIASGAPDAVRRDPRVLEAYLGDEAPAEGAGGGGGRDG
ncbi:MAG: ABC transporter ATP-binding protein [Acidobacteriota bacterium]|nr:ABC transporter ATP-binding protein [Acidobacteriota bacterium]